MQQPLATGGVLLLVLALGTALAGVARAQGGDDGISIGFLESASSWTGETATLGGILFPHFHVLGVVGDSSRDPATLALGAHDPQQANVDLLALEPGMSLRLGDYLEGFITNSYRTDSTGDFTGGVEEAFLKLTDLPGGFELRGGRFFNRVGFQNARHTHSWEFLDQHLMNARLLQEGELATIGGEVSWHFPSRFPAALTVALGAPPAEHDHGGEAHAEAEHAADEESLFEAERARFDDHIVSVNLLASWHYNDFHQFRGSLNFTAGENAFGETTRVFGAGVDYLWRENGLEPGGRYFRWRTEAMLREIEARAVLDASAARVRDTLDEFGAYTMITYGFRELLEASLRAGYVGGVDALDLEERWRISPALTYSLNPAKSAFLRLQYNLDHGGHVGESHSVWLGLGFNWGGSEVR